jgi:hypothetical protein
VSLSSQSFGVPEGTARSAFRAAARAHQAARHITGAAPVASPPRNAGEVSSVEGAIANASRQTGVDFQFLLAQARVESALNPDAKARTSSASGLYQFIESTWLDTMKRHGTRFGLGALADNINVGANGTAYVADPAQRAELLSLRNDPQVAAWMAAGLAEDNRAHLIPILGRQPDHGELYLAHFLGAGGAGRFLSAMQDNPHKGAAGLFAKAAAANPGIFYEADGSERSLAGVMRTLAGKIDRAMGLSPRGAPQTAWASYAAAAASPYALQTASAPYLVADEAVFMPGSGSQVTGGGAPRSAPTSARRAPLSDVLSATFDSGAAAPPRAQAQVRRAYLQLKAFGL